MVGVGRARAHPVKADLGGVGGTAVGRLTQVWGLGRDEKPPVWLRLVMHRYT